MLRRLTLIGVAVALGGATCSSVIAPPTPPGPNFVVILVDDLERRGFELGFHRRLPEPSALEHHLIEAGATFPNFFYPTALCCPSRASFLTGQYPHNHRVHGNNPAYDPDGLLLSAGLVEVVTAESSAPGQRHEHLRDHVHEIAIRAWAGDPADPETEVGGVVWIRAVEWVPYQRATFVTPAFAGYVSGHSTFSQAAAAVLARITGSDFFPEALGFDNDYVPPPWP